MLELRLNNSQFPLYYSKSQERTTIIKRENTLVQLHMDVISLQINKILDWWILLHTDKISLQTDEVLLQIDESH